MSTILAFAELILQAQPVEMSQIMHAAHCHSWCHPLHRNGHCDTLFRLGSSISARRGLICGGSRDSTVELSTFSCAQPFIAIIHILDPVSPPDIPHSSDPATADTGLGNRACGQLDATLEGWQSLLVATG